MMSIHWARKGPVFRPETSSATARISRATERSTPPAVAPTPTVADVAPSTAADRGAAHRPHTDRPPPAAALKSTLPFCFDTLAFEQWLQWVFVPRFWTLLQQRGPLPERCGIAPMADVWFADKPVEASDLIELLRTFDQALTAAD